MRALGSIAILVGIIMLLVSCNMDVSVPTEIGTRVNNLGLMHQQSMLLMSGFALILVGIVMRFAGRKRAEPVSPAIAITDGYSAEEIKDLDVLLAHKGRTGISLCADDPKVIHSVSRGSPADAAGVLAGDRLMQIDGSFVGNDLRDNVVQLTGEPGSTLNLNLRRGDKAVSVEVVRVAGDYPGVTVRLDAPRTTGASAGLPAPPGRSEGYGAWPYIVILAVLFFVLYVRMGR